MKKVMLLGALVLLSACGRDYYKVVETVVEVPVETIVEVPVETVVETVPETVEGLYYFEEVSSGQVSGALGVTVDYQGKIDVEQVQAFRS
jgi:hypothetical protein